MARDTTTEFLRALDREAPKIAAAFRRAVDGIVSDVDMAALAAAVEAQDGVAIMAVLGIDARAWVPLEDALEAALRAGVAYQADHLPQRPYADGARLRVQFGLRSERAEQWVRRNSSRLITEVAVDQREGIRVALQAGLEAGSNPTDTARMIAGRVQRGRGARRAGGVVGNHSQAVGWVMNAHAELSDPSRMASYFERRARDKRFDRTVRKAMDEGRPVARADLDRIVGRYSDRLLKLRADTIARTETLAALHAGREEAFEQLIEQGKIRANLVTRTWDATGDARVRSSHAAMEGQTVQFREPFTAPDGSRLMHPGDGSLGAGAAMVANCRCHAKLRADWLGMAS